MYADIITLFNHHKSSAGDIWYPTVISGVNLCIDKATITKRYGMDSKDKAILNIRYNHINANLMIGEKIYLPPKQWKKQNIDQLHKSITFSSGQDFDFFIKGDYGSTAPIADEKYMDGFYNHMNKEQDFVFAITSVAEYSVIPHFEILGA